MVERTEAQSWDSRYELGEYQDDPPIALVGEILEDLGEDAKRQLGLYPSCGNGRNFIPLLDAGLNLRGIDISDVAISQLVTRRPQTESLVRVASFDSITAASVFDYIVAIQVFQHGNTSTVQENFRQARDVLKSNGKLFLRVNSVSTQIDLKHHQTENNKYGGFTIVYDEGDKEGGKRHFFSQQELELIASSKVLILPNRW